MKIELNLHENSLDFLKESLEQYIIANEDGVHHSYKSDHKKKLKWKFAFINLVQANELLIKEIISEISPVLLKPNIDNPTNDEKTITFKQCISRLKLFSTISLSDEDISHLAKCAKSRNQFTHFNVSISSEEAKTKYCTLFSLHKRIYEEFSKSNLYLQGFSPSLIEEIIAFSDRWTIFRGYEILKENLKSFKENIAEAQKHPNFIDKQGTIIKRLAFGLEENFHKCIEEGDQDSCYTPTIFLWDFCDDCGAAQGEYHLQNCDLERCPICNGQALTCDCDLSWSAIE